MNIRLAVCPHDTSEKTIKWEQFAKTIAKLIGQEVLFTPFKDFDDEKNQLKTETFDIYYANPNIQDTLFERDYQCFAHFNTHKDGFVLIKKRDFHEQIKRIAIFNNKYILANLPYLQSTLQHSIPIFTLSYEQAIEQLTSGQVDCAIIYREFFEQIHNQNNFEIIQEISSLIKHCVMLHPDFYHAHKDAMSHLKDFYNITLLNGSEAQREKVLNIQLETLFDFIQHQDFSEAMLDIPELAVVIYQEKNVYINKTFQEITRYSTAELLNMRLEEMMISNNKDEIKETINRRLSGQKFNKSYQEYGIKTKDNKEVWFNAVSKTILFNGISSGILIGLDITKKRLLENLYKTIKEITSTATKAQTRDELYVNICQTLVNSDGIEFAWIGTTDEKKEHIKPIYHCGKEQNYLKSLHISFNNVTKKGQAASAYMSHNIIINPDIKTNASMRPFKTEMLKRGFISSAAIPLTCKDKVVAVLNIYSSQSNFFENEKVDILEELRQDANYALRNIEDTSYIKKINELITHGPIVIFEWEPTDNWHVKNVSQNVQRVLGISYDEILSPKTLYSDLIHKDDIKKISEDVTVFLNKKREKFIQYYRLFIKGKTVWVEDYSTVEYDKQGKPSNITGFILNITEKKKLEEQAWSLAHTDDLTKLHNSLGFSVKIDEILSQNHITSAALILIDIHNMKYINTHYTMQGGNALLQEVAHRLQASFHDGEVLSRVGGDEFAIFLTAKKDINKIKTILITLQNLFNKPIQVDQKELKASFNCGVTIYPNDGKNFQELYNNAFISLANAKLSGENSVNFFNAKMAKQAENYLFIENLIEKAFTKNLFVFYFQPYFTTATREVAGFEALIRIEDEDGTLYPPNFFINYLENSKYLQRFEAWALEDLLSKIQKYKTHISLNISGKSFKEPKFLDKFLQSKHQDLFKYLTIEITERELIHNLKDTQHILKQLKNTDANNVLNGISIAMDDFGTEYSSLRYLKDLPFDILKIDISFVCEITKGEKEKAIVETIIQLSKKLGIKTLAEGVETKEQFTILQKLGCDYIQGFYLSKPLPLNEVDNLLKKI